MMSYCVFSLPFGLFIHSIVYWLIKCFQINHIIPEIKRPSYFEIKAKLDAYRLVNPAASETKPTAVDVPQKPVNNLVIKVRSKIFSKIIAIWSLWYIQFTITLVLWLVAIKIEFGAVFFIIGALYWIWAWGTIKNPKPTISNNPDEQIISASFFFDNSPIPSNLIS
ncbi:hypothetical protein EWB00_001758 [Schistosoma japonicum]|uniref:Uncharacterized protein n=1 Tax=Schistosoma japonicum TaxID=6182 RepID=A0A4Z2DER3_SCHJA|nr:hypothetical protein KSF78_0001174 [Schistosoma japonicum]KAH8852618.1 hypothetical protein KSF78_0001174 [Schistosoma japonicum]KAH8852619.1 hypothetical protein KSF78_0001174 [Schistosoma japonicum]TNN14963.1 hypothetical protein EWB00_001758 [Schistosoma japonicum]TNN14964.1 hypothetical protein EWB00_001758 [Schistosoma japonicum]